MEDLKAVLILLSPLRDLSDEELVSGRVYTIESKPLIIERSCMEAWHRENMEARHSDHAVSVAASFDKPTTHFTRHFIHASKFRNFHSTDRNRPCRAIH